MSIYKRHRFPPDIIRHTVWLYYRFSLSFRDVEDPLAERGITVSYETIRYWCNKFGRIYNKRLKKNAGRFGDAWFMDEVFINIRGERFFKRLLTSNQGVSPWKIVTDAYWLPVAQL